MDKYSIKFLSAVYQNIDEIFEYIALPLNASSAALRIVNKLEEAIFSLEFMPQRGPKRRVGFYAKKEYRQIFVENFTIIYRINESKKLVIIVAIKYSKSEF